MSDDALAMPEPEPHPDVHGRCAACGRPLPAADHPVAEMGWARLTECPAMPDDRLVVVAAGAVGVLALG